MKLFIIAAILLGTVSMLLAQSCGNGVCSCGDNCYNCTTGYQCCTYTIDSFECCGCCSNGSPNCNSATIELKHPSVLWRRHRHS
uniref:Uncharacterized protein n=1 Tax=Acrobeloides nanus TaxID=290746 RepID=A0A914D5A5_9BILA